MAWPPCDESVFGRVVGLQIFLSVVSDDPLDRTEWWLTLVINRCYISYFPYVLKGLAAYSSVFVHRISSKNKTFCILAESKQTIFLHKTHLCKRDPVDAWLTVRKFMLMPSVVHCHKAMK